MEIAFKNHDCGSQSTNAKLLFRFQVQLYENCYIVFYWIPQIIENKKIKFQ